MASYFWLIGSKYPTVSILELSRFNVLFVTHKQLYRSNVQWNDRLAYSEIVQKNEDKILTKKKKEANYDRPNNKKYTV